MGYLSLFGNLSLRWGWCGEMDGNLVDLSSLCCVLSDSETFNCVMCVEWVMMCDEVIDICWICCDFVMISDSIYPRCLKEDKGLLRDRHLSVYLQPPKPQVFQSSM
jgi:hypothetical protein